jgi:MoaA/NifB/PqqE/SkfB family radical SAM enzyme
MPEAAALEKRKWVRLTRACNNRCLFCLDEEALDGSFLPLSAVKAELRAGRRAGCRRAILSGGEPTLHPEFLKVVALARKAGYRRVQTISNGRLFCYGDFLREAAAAGLDEVTFSVHGPDARTHDKLTGVKGSFAQTVRGISNALRVPGLIVSSDIVVNRLNVDRLARTLKFLYRLGVREYDLLQVMPFGRAWKNWRRLSYAPAAKKAALGKAFDFYKIPGVHLWANRFRPELLEGREELLQHPSKLLDEINGRRAMLGAFLRAGVPMPCAGARCRHCPLEGFCADLRVLRAGEALPALAPAFCLGGAVRRRVSVRAAAGLDKIGEFYIRHRLTVKGAGCAACAENSRCAGADIFEVMRSGFRALKPRERK